MKVLAKTRLPFNKLSTSSGCSTISACVNNYSIDESLMHYVRSPFDYSSSASDNDINNKILNADHFLNCLLVERCFNHKLRVLVNGSAISQDDLSSIVITSAYRCFKLNNLVNGSSTSLHLFGLAIDVYSDLPHVSKVISDYFVDWCNLVNTYTIKGMLYPVEVIRYSPYRIHIGFKYIV